MKTRPILFSAPMIRAIQEGRKTQTRRKLKPQPIGEKIWAIPGEMKCPHGIPGDELWVKETFAFSKSFDDRKPSAIGNNPAIEYRAGGTNINAERLCDRGKWRPSIFMPRWASRITLEITNVRVEKLQKISAVDAIAEGVSSRECVDRQGGKRIGYSADWSRVGQLSQYAGGYHPRNDKKPLIETDICLGSPQMAYANLWIKINGRDSWNENPFVWVISFKWI